MNAKRFVAASLLALAPFTLAGGMQRTPSRQIAAGMLATAPWPYFPGSLLPLTLTGFAPPYSVEVLGPGQILAGNEYEIPQTSAPGTARLTAANRFGLASTELRIGAPPSGGRSLLAVASYETGLVIHDADTFSVLGVLATGGVPSDVAIDRGGRIATTDTQGSAVTVASLRPWNVEKFDGAPAGDEIAIDEATHAIFVTDRDWNGTGALTKIDPSGTATRTATGQTAEGLAIDQRRQLVYVANVNDGTVAVVDARSMRVLRRFFAIPRVFSLALSPDGNRLYAVSNQSVTSPFAAAGRVVAFSLPASAPRIVARSAKLTFPLGAALDARSQTLFVTDEELGVVDVLDATTLAPKREPLHTCKFPWKPAFDPTRERLYVPCAGDDRIDAFGTRAMRRIAGAPFATGGYPLAIAVWTA